MLAPDGVKGTIPMESVHDALKAGGQLIGMNPAAPQPPEQKAGQPYRQDAADPEQVAKDYSKKCRHDGGRRNDHAGRRRHHHCQPGTEESC